MDRCRHLAKAESGPARFGAESEGAGEALVAGEPVSWRLPHAGADNRTRVERQLHPFGGQLRRLVAGSKRRLIPLSDD